MITAIGLGTDPTMRYFCATAAELGAAVLFVDLFDAVSGRWEVRLPPDDGSWLSPHGGARRALDPSTPCYCRLIDLGGVDPANAVTWRTIVTAFAAWLELHDGVVVNRPGHVADNSCKPLHEARLAALGLAVPESFSGSGRAALRAFVAAGPTVVKALSGQRADCRRVTTADFDDYDERSGPVHLQRFVGGDDVRAHVIGETVVAVRIRSHEQDYRLDGDARFEPCELPAEIAERLRSAASQIGLAFSGWDLRLGKDDWWVLEANPMPGYSYYDRRIGGRITRVLLDFLATRSDPGGVS